MESISVTTYTLEANMFAQALPIPDVAPITYSIICESSMTYVKKKKHEISGIPVIKTVDISIFFTETETQKRQL